MLWQQIGNNSARATATWLQCNQVRRCRKSFWIIGFAMSAQCHHDVTPKQGI
jgi:hypothetical protein